MKSSCWVDMKHLFAVRVVVGASIIVPVLLALLGAVCVPTATGSEPKAFDPFFYGAPVAQAATGPADATDTPVATVAGTVYQYDSTWTTTAWVQAVSYDSSGSYLGSQSGSTSYGQFELVDVPVGSGELWVSYDDRLVSLRREGLQFLEGYNRFVVIPGAVAWTNTGGGPLGASSQLRIVLAGTASDPDGSIWSQHRFAGGTTSGAAWSLPGVIQWSQCYYRDNEVATWTMADTTSTLTVSAWALSGPIGFDQGSAARMRIVSPRWNSGKPGTVMKVRFENWPQWTHLALTGLDASLPATTWNDLTYDTSTSPVTSTFDLKVPATAKVGRTFTTDGQGRVTELDVPTYVQAYFQVCTLTPDRAKIAKGELVRLRGRVPVRLGPDGTAGTRKYVTIWARGKSATDAPAAWDPRASGWHKVATVRTDAYGRYVTPAVSALKPTQSTSYVCRYPSDAFHFRAYTSVCRVTVR
jgi:hypothetical protein